MKYHLWRHLGASMLNQTHPLQIDTKHIAARIKRELGPFLRGTKEDKKVLGEIGDDIASTAARITRAIQIQKANYCVMYVDPDTLDDRDFRFEPGSAARGPGRKQEEEKEVTGPGLWVHTKLDSGLAWGPLLHI